MAKRRLPFTIWLTVDWLMLKDLATLDCFSPSATRDLMASTSDSESLEFQCDSPRTRGRNCRPRSTMSRALSALVPGLRCSGLMQGGLSQECSTRAGSLRSNSNHRCAASRWAFTILPRNRTLPYPSALRAPRKIQQPVAESTSYRSSSGIGLGPYAMATSIQKG